jgi:hypothetical protein
MGSVERAEGMPLLVVISLLTTPYGWFFDQVILLPCLFQAASWLATSRQSPLRVGVMTVYLSANATVLTLIRLHLTTFWYVWTISVWFALYALTQINRPPLPNRTAPSQ